MGCCGGKGPYKKHTLKEYILSAAAITAFILSVYLIILIIK